MNQTLCAAISHIKADDLSCQTRNGQPQVFVASLEAVTDDQLVNLQCIARNGRQQRFGKAQARLPGLFLSSSRTVVRATLNVRAMARCDTRSCKAAVMSASFSADKARRRACGVQVLRHAWQRRRCVPQRFEPKRNEQQVLIKRKKNRKMFRSPSNTV